MKLKIVEVNGQKLAAIDDAGNPVYVHDDGKEIGFDAKGAASRITALNAEAKNHREAKERAEAALKGFEGLDAEKAKAALETLANIDAGKLLDADKVKEIKEAARRSAEEAVAEANKRNAQALAEREAENKTLTSRLHGHMLKSAFGSSKFVQDSLIIPVDIAMSAFGGYFKVEGDEIVGYEADGQTKIYSRKDHGTPAKFEEALEIVVDRYPNKDRVLKAPGGGSGARSGAAGGGGDLSKLSPVERMKAVRQQRR